MYRRLQALACIVLLSAFLLIAHAQDRRGRKYVPPPATAKIAITVMRESNGKPIRDAAVIFHPIKNGKDEGAMELKTDEDGKTSLDVIPIGATVRLQIIANGFQTFGNDYLVDADTKAITVKMKRPVAQYSIYKGNATGDQSGQATDRSQSQPEPQKQQPPK
ncbi:MAG: hypothetical protein ACR2JE_14205 [Acidobacteriaceae bacterium]